MILTTTNSIEGRTIVKYFTPVSKSVVLGVNAIADIGSSFTDFFGGRSSNYESRLQAINDSALEMLKKHALKIKASAVVGIKTDVGEVSGGGKGMIMVTVVGTPVLLSREESKNAESGSVGHSYVNDKIRARAIVDSGSDHFGINDSDLSFIVSTGFEEFLPIIKLAFNQSSNFEPTEREKKDKVLAGALTIFDNMDDEMAKQYLYNWIADVEISNRARLMLRDAIVELNLVDYKMCKTLISFEELLAKKLGLSLLVEDKSYYSEDDIVTMEELNGNVLELLFPDMPLKEEKGIMGFKSRWHCDCGVKNSEKEPRCSCGRDRKGFFRKEIKPKSAQAIVDYKVQLLRGVTER